MLWRPRSSTALRDPIFLCLSRTSSHFYSQIVLSFLSVGLGPVSSGRLPQDGFSPFVPLSSCRPLFLSLTAPPPVRTLARQPEVDEHLWNTRLDHDAKHRAGCRRRRISIDSEPGGLLTMSGSGPFGGGSGGAHSFGNMSVLNASGMTGGDIFQAAMGNSSTFGVINQLKFVAAKSVRTSTIVLAAFNTLSAFATAATILYECRATAKRNRRKGEK